MKFFTFFMLLAMATPATAQQQDPEIVDAGDATDEELDAELEAELALDDDIDLAPIDEQPSLQFPTVTQAPSVPTKDCKNLKPTAAMLASQTVHKPEFIGVSTRSPWITTVGLPMGT